MALTQLNVWIPEELKNYIAQRAQAENRGMNAIISELIQQDIARRDNQFVESNNLTVLREALSAEIRQAHAQLRRDLREDREHETERLQVQFRKQIDRLAGLTVNAIRNGSITRRLTYVILSKAYGTSFATRAYEDAREKAHQELLPKRVIVEGQPPVPEDEQSI